MCILGFGTAHKVLDYHIRIVHPENKTAVGTVMTAEVKQTVEFKVVAELLLLVRDDILAF